MTDLPGGAWKALDAAAPIVNEVYVKPMVTNPIKEETEDLKARAQMPLKDNLQEWAGGIPWAMGRGIAAGRGITPPSIRPRGYAFPPKKP
jgi:hypothetical protein